jgi:hypothetical protein
MIYIGKCSFRAFLCVGLILAAVLPGSVSPVREVAVIKVEHRWVEIGGTADQKNEIIREIISLSRSGGNSSTSMSLRVERP